jgi:hypothetical protein
MTEYVFSELHKGNVVGLVALDLKKAFDTVNHHILLSKMKLYGVDQKELAWFTSYLNNRQQVCCLDACSSDPLTIDCGVPQGSILGPLLFILYVNDLPRCFSQCQVNIYADDTAFYVAKRTVNEINQILQTELDQVHNWLCANKLSLHVGETASMLLCSRQKRPHLQNQHLSLNVQNEEIGQVEGLKYLGVHIDQNLNFNKHIDDVCKKLRRALGVLRRASPFINQATRVTLYNTLMLPHFEYCCTVWGCSITQSNLHQLQIIQNCAMRIILNCDSRTHIDDMLKDLHWLNVEKRLLYNMSVLVWKCNAKRVPSYLHNVFIPQQSVHRYSTRSSSQAAFATVPSHRQSFLQNGTKVWNTIPCDIRNQTSINVFKQDLHSHLLTI